MKNASETPEDQLLRIAEGLPAFGGMFYDGDGILNIYLLEPDQTDEVHKAVAVIFGEEVLLTRKLVEQAGLPPAVDLAQSQVKILKGQYGFLQLREWYWESGKLLHIKGVIFMDIDEAKNRVVLGVEKGNIKAREHVERKLSQLPVPREAIVVEEADSVVQFRNRKGIDQLGVSSKQIRGHCSGGCHR